MTNNPEQLNDDNVPVSQDIEDASLTEKEDPVEVFNEGRRNIEEIRQIIKTGEEKKVKLQEEVDAKLDEIDNIDENIGKLKDEIEDIKDSTKSKVSSNSKKRKKS